MSDFTREAMFARMPVAELVDDLRDVHLSPSQPMRDRAADLLGELEAIVRDHQKMVTLLPPRLFTGVDPFN